MKEYEVIIIGSGFSGICTAIKLQENNIHNYLILERDESLGGTWWRNSYPGAAVDVPSRLYSFSFEKFDWSRLFAKQEEILSYTQNIIQKYQLASKAQTNVNIESLVFDDNLGKWKVYLKDGSSLICRFVVSATGGLSQPAFPKIPGLDNFKGKYFHTSLWDHSYDYKGKNIAVIGTGASAVQVVPEIAKEAAHVEVLQRTPHWILPRPDRKLKHWERSLLQIGLINKSFRAFTYFQNESRALFFLKFPKLAKLVKLQALAHLKKQVKSKELRKALEPNFDIGCKRVLLTNDYYPSLERSNVNLNTKAIESITEDGILFKDQTSIKSDLIVFATGFRAAENSVPFEIKGRNNVSIHDYWKEGAVAYYGISVANFPNLFMAMGPNTGTGHTSVIYFIESQMKYIMDAINKAKANSWKSVEVKETVQNEFNVQLQEKMKRTIWSVGGCKSWYTTENGKNTTMYPNFSFVYRSNTKSFKDELHLIEKN